MRRGARPGARRGFAGQLRRAQLQQHAEPAVPCLPFPRSRPSRLFPRCRRRPPSRAPLRPAARAPASPAAVARRSRRERRQSSLQVPGTSRRVRLGSFRLPAGRVRLCRLRAPARRREARGPAPSARAGTSGGCVAPWPRNRALPESLPAVSDACSSCAAGVDGPARSRGDAARELGITSARDRAARARWPALPARRGAAAAVGGGSSAAPSSSLGARPRFSPP